MGLSSERVLLWSRSSWTGRPKDFLGHIPLTDISTARFEAGRLGDKLFLEFNKGNTLELESVKIDKGEDFVNQLQALLNSN
ncbi:MAG: hypothetical protein IIA45_03520 [Bacteroidetes bacterium]|nr:hypothetical protein [Bacteroidota bacterium]